MEPFYHQNRIIEWYMAKTIADMIELSAEKRGLALFYFDTNDCKGVFFYNFVICIWR